ncbi:MAG: CDP-diacylglycerol--glycerol-3-phosphate 3-phosphatidyltransferase [Polyangiaceae bacterium]|nr:CDP-diacylglycerol--glycerol-3-phosphate 3-phosphatidyltransferase [Polyangiaceae bacterium]MCW5791389.1 CDP-diacylglycerol--glycerol-3-phosphate 3-phosphatidyltransferase [Polyangiaceae bacterium]
MADPRRPKRTSRRREKRSEKVSPEAIEARKARRQSLRQDAVNLPNLLTFGRIAIIPLVLWLLDRGTPKDCVYAAWVYAAAAITDLLDGYLARKMGVVSVLGKFLDPLADKLLVMAVLIWLVPMGRISEWVVIVLLGREISITGLRSIASSEGVVIAAGDGGKSKTALQMIGLLCLVIGYPYPIDLGFLDLGVVDLVVVGRWLVYLSLVFSFASAFQYVGLFAEAVEAKDRRRASS